MPHAAGGAWRAAWQPNIRDKTPEGAETRANLARIADVEQRKSNEMIGAELGYRYDDSPIIWPEAGDGPAPNFMRYVPTSWPGARLPHVWLSDGVRCMTASATATRFCVWPVRRQTARRWRVLLPPAVRPLPFSTSMRTGRAMSMAATSAAASGPACRVARQPAAG